MKKILSINPGSTSTKIALYEEKTELFCTTIRHSDEEIGQFEGIADQYDFRKDLVLAELKNKGYALEELSAVVGRGGIFPNIEAGGYLVNEAMKEKVFNGEASPHASNLGSLVSEAIATPLGIPAYIYDCVSSDAMMDKARITGLPSIRRKSECHVLNTKAIARMVAENAGKQYNEMNFIVAHLGGGISVSAHEKGVIVDCLPDDQGPFSPERAGALPTAKVMELCFSGEYTKKEFSKILRGNGGMKAYLGTADCIAIEAMIAEGNELAREVYEAQAYQVARGMCSLIPAIDGDLDAFIITGGIAHSKLLTGMISDYVSKIGKVEIVPGENEMEALTFGALRILNGEEDAKVYLG